MKIVFLSLLLGSTGFCAAQSPAPVAPVTRQALAASAGGVVSDSIIADIHQRFQRGRLYGVAAFVSGGLVTSGSVFALQNSERRWSGYTGLGIGVSGLVLGAINYVRFRPQQERKVIDALTRGEPLPPYVARVYPLWPKKSY